MVINKDKASLPRLPWLQEDLEMDAAVLRLTNQLHAIKTQRMINAPLDEKTEKRLKRNLQDAEQGRSTAGKFMRALAKEIGVEDSDNAYKVADMKSWDRIVSKYNSAATARDIRDLGRGCIYVDDVSEYEEFTKILRQRTKDGHLSALNMDKVAIIEGSVDDYLAHPKDNGYAGSVNLNIEMDIGKGRSGIFEVQIRPRAYEDTNSKSHKLFSMIRIFKNIPEAYMTEQDVEVRNSLIIANSAMYEEHGARSGIDKVRKTPPLDISQARAEKICGILDRIRTQLETSNGRNSEWRIETANAITYAKTSVMNIATATSYRRKPVVDIDIGLDKA